MGSSVDSSSLPDEDEKLLLSSDDEVTGGRRGPTLRWERRLWILLTLFLCTIQALTWSTIIKKPTRNSYEEGFATDLSPAKAAIRLREETFDGGIIVNSTGDWELIINPWHGPYVGKPTAELDNAWDQLVGSYIPLTAEDAATVQGAVSAEQGAYYVVPHFRHSLHCVNYLRKAIYHKNYPTILTESREHVPPFFMHVDHCIETLRETIQCNMDLTPVPHVWNEVKGMYLASTMLRHTCRNFDAFKQWQDDFTT